MLTCTITEIKVGKDNNKHFFWNSAWNAWMDRITSHHQNTYWISLLIYKSHYGCHTLDIHIIDFAALSTMASQSRLLIYLVWNVVYLPTWISLQSPIWVCPLLIVYFKIPIILCLAFSDNSCNKIIFPLLISTLTTYMHRGGLLDCCSLFGNLSTTELSKKGMHSRRKGDVRCHRCTGWGLRTDVHESSPACQMSVLPHQQTEHGCWH